MIVILLTCQDCSKSPERLPARETDTTYYCESCKRHWTLGYKSETSGAWYYFKPVVEGVLITRTRDQAEAKRRYDAGETLHFSTSIEGLITYGYGELDEYGFWEFPCGTTTSHRFSVN